VTWTEAAEVLLQGGKVRLPYWTKGLYVEFNDLGILCWSTGVSRLFTRDLLTAKRWEEVK
jgi:hypothetical protein